MHAAHGGHECNELPLAHMDLVAVAVDLGAVGLEQEDRHDRVPRESHGAGVGFERFDRILQGVFPGGGEGRIALTRFVGGRTMNPRRLTAGAHVAGVAEGGQEGAAPGAGRRLRGQG